MSVLDRRILPDGMALSTWRGTDGWQHRRFDWPAGDRPRGSLLFQIGRAAFAEMYVEPLARWHARGWHVAGFEWRGQGGSGRLLGDARTGHLASLDPLLDDLAAVVAAGRTAAPGPHIIVGHSMGAHLALRLLAERKSLAPAAAVLVAPMLSINSGRLPDPVARTIARLACAAGRAERRMWEQGTGPAWLQAEQRRLTDCPDRYADHRWWKESRPDLVLGPPSWGWLAAAYASTARLDRRGVLEGVATPLLLLGTERDRLVSADAIRAAAARLPDATLHMSAAGGHELLREIDAVREPVMAAIDRFLDARAPRR